VTFEAGFNTFINISQLLVELEENVKNLCTVPKNAIAALFTEAASTPARIRLCAAHRINRANEFFCKIFAFTLHHPGEESSVLSAEDYFRIQLKEIVDVLVADLSRRSKVLQETSLNFEFLSGPAFISMK
jgi:hypothetical protein